MRLTSFLQDGQLTIELTGEIDHHCAKKYIHAISAKIEAYIDGEIGEIPLATGENIGRTVDYAAGRNRYIGHLISLATRSFKDMKIALDCSNGSASAIAKSVYDALGADTYVINNAPGGLNVNLNCGSTHMEGLQQLVREKKLDDI